MASFLLRNDNALNECKELDCIYFFTKIEGRTEEYLSAGEGLNILGIMHKTLHCLLQAHNSDSLM